MKAHMHEAPDEFVDCTTKPEFLGKIFIVLVGYGDEMERMLNANPGLASRFATDILFRSLSGKDFLALLVKKIEQTEAVQVRIGVSDSERHFTEKIVAAFEVLGRRKGWGNGRDVENIAREVIGDFFSSMPENPDAELVVDGAMILNVLQTWIG